MKKLILATMLAAVMGTASAVEVGVNAGFNTSGVGAASYGVTVGQSFGKFGLTAEYDRDLKSKGIDNRFSAIASYDLFNVGNITVTPKLGVSYLNPETVTSGYAALGGVGVSLPLSKHVFVTGDYRYQYGQDSVKSLNGHQLFAGLKVKF